MEGLHFFYMESNFIITLVCFSDKHMLSKNRIGMPGAKEARFFNRIGVINRPSVKSQKLRRHEKRGCQADA